jgi:hypothetical protein
MLTGLMLDLSGCSPPKFFARVSSRILHILLRMHFAFSFSDVFYDFSRFSQLRMSHLAGHGRCSIMLFAMLWFWLKEKKLI